MSAARLATRKPDNLPTAVRMWPTPTADCATERQQKYAQGGEPLTLAVKLWPTPAARDFRAPNNPQGASRLSRPPKSGEQLPNAVGGVLHPEWVEKLMGYPAGWTELDQWKPGRGTRRASSAEAPSTAGLG